MNTLASRGQLRASFIRWALFTVPACVLLGYLAGQFGSANTVWFQSLEKPGIYPPSMWFGIVWTVLYVMMGLALALVCAAWGARGRSAAIVAFVAQFLLNLTWTPVFFGAQSIMGGLAVIAVLDILVLLTVVLFWRVRALAGALLLPYLAWVLFATALNYQFLQLNPDGGAGSNDGAVERVRIGE